jgi:hypothetical protein
MKLKIKGGAEISVSQMITYNLFVKEIWVGVYFYFL